LSLCTRQIQFIAELEDVERTGITIELGGQRQAHALASPEISDLLFAEGLNWWPASLIRHQV
jgi:hypothetical protein